MYIASIFFSFIYAHWMYVRTHLKIMGQWKSTLIDKFTLKKKDLLKFFWASGFSYCIPASIKLESMKDLLDRFAEIDSNRDGMVDLEEFAEYLNLPVTRQVKHLFSLYDRVSIKRKFTM